MNYISTRGGIMPVNFADAVLMGLATDGGLLIPESIPTVTADQLQNWAGLRFQALAAEIMRPFIGDSLPDEVITDLIERAYANFNHPEITPLHQVGQRQLLELFHGPTAAFKDIALQWLGELFDYLLTQNDSYLNILGATSGDTGSAAIAGVSGKARINIFILYPHGRISPIQERQMTTVTEPNVQTIAVQGTFDDAQRIVKTLFSDVQFKTRYQLGAVNSINWARILAQTVYYFYAWGRVSGGNPDHRVSFAVPTGNFGDVFAGYLAKRMGLPIEQLILATNRNAILTRFVQTGIYAAGDVYQTLSPAMDIQIASNFERYLYYLLDENATAVRTALTNFEQERRLIVNATQRRQVNKDFIACAVDDSETLAQMQAVYDDTGYFICPHTAVGMHAAANYPDAICLATAHPAKFNEAVQIATGQTAPLPLSLQGLMNKPTRQKTLAADADVIRQYLQTTLDNTENYND
ncbi:threonine synthase [Rhodopseudomonas palustris]|uniref:Threonine synthase n=1 Tax=Thiospirillum jenense TaxID=1653858 RepID=A0A839H2W6_9GAMM|nr:threonine synthase [Thiospirillum jenense]MBB1089685.1 threonine synthase [Rhodopseudomonas palustris]MBB1124785.1 threonine synthase [Thiospirillum jenense]